MRLGAEGEPMVSADDRVQAFDWWVEWSGPEPREAELLARRTLREVVGLTPHDELAGSPTRLEDEVRRALAFAGGEVGEVRVALGTMPGPPASPPRPPETGDPVGPERLAGPVVSVPVGHAGVSLRRGKPVRELGPGLSTILPGRLRMVDLREHRVDVDGLQAWYAVTDASAAVAAGVAGLDRAVGEQLRTLARAAGSEPDVRDALDAATVAWGVRVNRIDLDRGASAPVTSVPEGSRP